MEKRTREKYTYTRLIGALIFGAVFGLIGGTVISFITYGTVAALESIGDVPYRNSPESLATTLLPRGVVIVSIIMAPVGAVIDYITSQIFYD